ncbi:hypothetical protein SCH01S_48_01310 [Sphingomonas changbaiensis NBRC 104936]|uniref:PEP-CTERM protein-sorting domain-containing protein n=1 Tax=Sphingomonas changbaiensis NBRC 104936 TaxID=1219043 RepID=A0A0E9MST3_9SPHN|nr:hypothetical protein [Sphingomonas changbaiensis]GAO40471.1 hypothetical protein SCH01S_48_01310 [Sphingomonas changbaiensis NBRC 104936]
MTRGLMIVGAALAASVAVPAGAWVSVYVETSPVHQASIAAGSLLEDFAAAVGAPFRSTFGSSDFGARFAGFNLSGPTASGDTFGASAYAATSSSASITFDRAVKYLSFRTAALDGNDTMELFSRGRSLGYYNLVDSAAAAGFGSDPARNEGPYTYVNFFTDEGFDEIRFTQSAGSFALDDVAVGQITAVTAVPEVQTWAMLILGFGVAGTAFRMRRRAVRTA